jgi:hypothetical protein
MDKLVSNFKLIALANCRRRNNKLVLANKQPACLLQINNVSWQPANSRRPLVNQLLD